MRISSAIFGLFLLFLSVSCTPESSEKNENIHPRTANDWLFRQRAYPSGAIDQEALRAAIRYRKDLERQPAATRSLMVNEWTFAGPTNIGGRVTDVEVRMAASDTIYVGAASGGIFRSSNMGAAWTPVFDDAANLAIGDIALAPGSPGVLYAGTGEANAGGGSIAYDGAGVYRSDDGGDTWQSVGLEGAGSIGRMLVDPDDADRVYVAAMGTLFANNAQRGVFRTTDGGDTWEQVLYLSDSTGAIDLTMHPEQPEILYAAMWERVRRPDRRQYTGATSGVYKTVDGGDTWIELTNGLPAQPAQKGRIGLAIAPSEPDILYAAYAGENGYLNNIYRSADGGQNWSPINTLGIFSVPYEWWFNRLVVSPDDPEKVFYIGLELNEYQPATGMWTERFPGTHVDQHALWIHPDDPDYMLLGNDGGLHFSVNGGISYAKFNNLPITQFYTCAFDFQLPERLYGGTQDNGTNRTLTGALDDWTRIFGGDGFRVIIDPTDNNYVYAEYQYGNLGRSINGGNSFLPATAGISGDARRNWNTPVVMDPSIPSTLYLGAEKVYRSTDRAVSWTAISPDLTNGPGGGNLVFGTITALSVSPLDGQVIWAGADDGNVWVTENGGDNWAKVSEDLPERWVTSIAADPEAPHGAFVTYSGYRFGENMGHIYYTENLGSTWSDRNGNLPDVPVNDLVVDPANGNLYLATDVGVFYSMDSGGAWDVLGQGLPTVVITDLDLHTPSGKLLAGTYGRSMWTIPVADLVAVAAERPAPQLAGSVFPNPFREQTVLELFVRENHYVTIALFDESGRRIQTVFQGTLPRGDHRFDLNGGGLAPGMYRIEVVTPAGRRHWSVIKF